MGLLLLLVSCSGTAGSGDRDYEEPAQRLVYEDFEDNNFLDSFSQAFPTENVWISTTHAIGVRSGNMYGGVLGAAFDCPVTVTDGDIYYFRYYAYYPNDWTWTLVSDTGMKNFRAMPTDGWPLFMIKVGTEGQFQTHSYFEVDQSTDIPPWKDMASWPALDQWHLHEIIVSYSGTSGGFAWYLDSQLISGIPPETFDQPTWPRTYGSELTVNNFRICGGNGYPPDDTYYVDNIEIWRGIPSVTGEPCGNGICAAGENSISCSADCS